VTEATLQRVPLAEVQDLIVAGEPLPFRVLDAAGRLLLGAGQRVQGPSQLEALLERGACVEREEVQAVRQARGLHVEPPDALRAVREATWFDAWEQQMWALDRLLRTLGRDPSQALELQGLVDRQLALVAAQPDAALFLAVRQDERRHALYALTHGMHCATVAGLTAGLLGWAPARVRSVVGAALTMNLAIIELQAQMAEQSDPPSRRQMDQIRAHPQEAARRLEASGLQDPGWLQAVREHHERRSGSGYPQGLEQPDEGAQLLRAADVFTAKISPRQLRRSMSPQAAARELYQQEAGGPLAAALIRAVGVYPPGDLVLLRNGESGVVATRADTGHAAVVVALADSQGRPVPGAPRRDTGRADWAITGVWPSDRPHPNRVLPEQVYGLLPPPPA
jgi:HD-GYP domain-containing protein (c-di-GMP phosphodiesterase class II)